jgi:hypothetical protein
VEIRERQRWLGDRYVTIRDKSISITDLIEKVKKRISTLESEIEEVDDLLKLEKRLSLETKKIKLLAKLEENNLLLEQFYLPNDQNSLEQNKSGGSGN